MKAMLKYLQHFLILFSMFLGSNLSSQPCNISALPNTSLTLSTQQEIDDFQSTYGPCDSILTSITVSDNLSSIDAITNLSGLSQIKYIQQDLTIILTSGLVDLEGLNSLESIGSDLIILDNFGLESLSGLNNLREAQSINIRDQLPLLCSLDGLGSLQSLERLVINDTKITSLEGIGPIDSLSGGLLISFNGSLENLDGLESLEYIGGDVDILSNPQLANVDALCNLKSIGNSLELVDNQSLSDCCALCPLVTALEGSTSVMVFNNNDGCNSRDEITGCDVCGGDKTNTEPEIVPTLGEWSIVILGLLLLIFCCVGLRKSGTMIQQVYL